MLRLGAKGLRHGVQRVHADAEHRASPTGVGHAYGLVLGVVEEEGHAVGRADAKAHARLLCDEGIRALQKRCPGIGIGSCDKSHVCLVYLVRNQQVAGSNAQTGAEFLPAFCHMLGGVATIAVGVERGVGIANFNNTPLCRKGCDMCGYIVAHV